MSDSEIGEKLNINRSTSYRHRRKMCIRDSYNTNDIVSGASTGQVIYRFCDTLSDRSVSFCFCKTLSQLVSDISCIKVWEDKNVSLTCNRASRSFRSTYACLLYTSC